MIDFSKLTLPELKGELRKRKLPLTGNKPTLVDRLVEYENKLLSKETTVSPESVTESTPKSAEPDTESVSVSRMSVVQLREQLNKLNLSTKGNKAELVERLVANQKTTAKPRANPLKRVPPPQKKKTETKVETEDIKSQHGTLPESSQTIDDDYTKEKLHKLKLPELKKLLIAHNLQTHGNKPDLIARLMQFKNPDMGTRAVTDEGVLTQTQSVSETEDKPAEVEQDKVEVETVIDESDGTEISETSEVMSRAAHPVDRQIDYINDNIQSVESTVILPEVTRSDFERYLRAIFVDKITPPKPAFIAKETGMDIGLVEAIATSYLSLIQKYNDLVIKYKKY